MRRHIGKTALETLLYLSAGRIYQLVRLVSKHRTFITEVSRKIKFTDLVLQLFSVGAAVEHRYL